MSAEIVRVNECWRVAFSDRTGDIVRMAEVQTGAERVFRAPEAKDAVAEGGHDKPNGLSLWVKTGAEPDHNTGVLSAFADVQNAPRSIRESPAGITVSSAHGGIQLEVSYVLPAGRRPLRVKARLENTGGPADAYQFECFYQWFVAGSVWAQTAYSLPGLPVRSLFPFGELYYRGGSGTEPGAFWWQAGTTHGVAIRPLTGISKFFVGVQVPSFVLGPQGEARRIGPGESIEMEFEIAPLRYALEQGGWAGKAAADTALREDHDRRRALARRLGSVASWCRHATPAVARRSIHVTTQYVPVKADTVLHLVDRLLAPCGFNEIVFEVGRNFRYRSHPAVAPEWAWDADTWKHVVREVRAMGFEVIPQYNALAHMGESGLTRAYPELAEDPGGWCLNPEHPKTAPYLGDLFGELIEAFESRVFHVGLDEIDVPSRKPTFALAKPGRARDGGELFALHVNALHRYLKEHGQEMMMWADMLLYKPEHRIQHGLRPGTWQAIDRIPRDIILVDWIYHPVPDFGGSRYLKEKGFRVMGASWHTPGNIRDWAQAAVRYPLDGLMHTLWTPPRIQDVNMVCTLLAGRYFQNPSAPPVAETVPEAEALSLALVESR